MKWTPEKRMAVVGGVVLFLDQVTKWLIVRSLPSGHEIALLPGFFRLVHWENTGAAWSLFHGNNLSLAAVSAVALFVLYYARRYLEGETLPGQWALGLIFGGIAGNLVDRLARDHVVDFLYFHVFRRDGRELGFPAFNIADTAICTGVGIILLLSWRTHPASSGPTGGTPERKSVSARAD